MPSTRERNPLYVHTLTTQFANTLDEIPQDMSRHFADLRELDAVLSASLQQITQRINDLTETIEDTLAPGATHNPAQLFQAITEIADETQRIKLGGEDKIRVASLAADNMHAYYNHLEELIRQMQPLDEALQLPFLAPKTAYPHVPPGTYNDIQMESRRTVTRRAAQANGYSNPNGRSHVIESPVKRRRINTKEDTDESTPKRGVHTLDSETYKPGGMSRPRVNQRRPRPEVTPQGSPAVPPQQLPPFRAHPPSSSLGVNNGNKGQSSHSPLLPQALPAAPNTSRRAPPSTQSRHNDLPMVPVDMHPYYDPNPRHGGSNHVDYMPPPHPMMHQLPPPPPQSLHVQSAPPAPLPITHHQPLHGPHSSQYMRAHPSLEASSVASAPPYEEPRNHHPSHNHPIHPPPSVSAPPKSYRYVQDRPEGMNPGLSQPMGSLPPQAPPPQSSSGGGPSHKEEEPAQFIPNRGGDQRDHNTPMTNVFDVRSSGPNQPNERPQGPPPTTHRTGTAPAMSARERVRQGILQERERWGLGPDDVSPFEDDNKAYCICQQGSWGEMIGCDASDCEIEWYHLGCLNLTEPPVGMWICSACTQRHKRGRKGTRKKVASRRGGRM